MAIDVVGLVVLFVPLSVMAYLPFLIVRTARLGDRKTLKYPDRKRWLVLAICAGELIGFGFVLQFVMAFFLSRNQLNQLPVPVQALWGILVLVGAIGVLWAGTKSGLGR